MSNTLGVDQSEDPLAIFWQKLCRRGAVKALLVIAIVVNCIQAFSTLSHRHEQQDFAHYYASSQLWLEGEPVYQTDLGPRYEALGWKQTGEPIFHATNPPPLVALFSPFAMLKPQVAHVAWLLFQLSCLVFAIWLSWQCVKDEISIDGFYLVLSVFLFLPFVSNHLFYSQVQLLLMAMILFAFRLTLAAKKRSSGIHGAGYLACGIIAVATAIKIYPLVLLPWFVWHSHKGLLHRVVAGLVAVLVLVFAVWMTGLHQWLDFYEFALPVIKSWMKAGYECFTLGSASHQLGGVLVGDIESETWLKCGSILGFLLLALYYVRLVFRPLADDRKDLNVEFALLILLMLFCGGTCWWHYLVFLIFPMQVIATRTGSRLTFATLAISGLVVLLFANIELPSLSVANIEILNPVANQRPLWGMMLMAVFLVSCLKSNDPTGLAKR